MAQRGRVLPEGPSQAKRAPVMELHLRVGYPPALDPHSLALETRSLD